MAVSRNRKTGMLLLKTLANFLVEYQGQSCRNICKRENGNHPQKGDVVSMQKPVLPRMPHRLCAIGANPVLYDPSAHLLLLVLIWAPGATKNLLFRYVGYLATACDMYLLFGFVETLLRPANSHTCPCSRNQNTAVLPHNCLPQTSPKKTSRCRSRKLLS